MKCKCDIPDESDVSDGEGEFDLEIPYMLARMERVCAYPSSPADYFTQRSNEISASAVVVKHLRELFNLPHPNAVAFLPGEITKICTSYYEDDNVQTMIAHTIKDLKFFEDGDVLLHLFWQSPSSEYASLMLLARTLSIRANSYLWWFLLRSRVPLFVPMKAFAMHSGLRDCQLEDHDDEVVVTFSKPNWNEMASSFPNAAIRKFPGGGEDLDNGNVVPCVPYPDLIGPCLNTSSVTLEQVTACSVALESRTQIGRDKWLSFVFDLFLTFAAIELWVSNDECFVDWETEEPLPAHQSYSLQQWNRFSRQYHFGSQFCVSCCIRTSFAHERNYYVWPREEDDFKCFMVRIEWIPPGGITLSRGYVLRQARQ